MQAGSWELGSHRLLLAPGLDEWVEGRRGEEFLGPDR